MAHTPVAALDRRRTMTKHASVITQNPSIGARRTEIRPSPAVVIVRCVSRELSGGIASSPARSARQMACAEGSSATAIV